MSGTSNAGNISKKILCCNILSGVVCNYGQKCLYAHSLSEQKIEPIRHKAYTIIKSKNDLSTIDLISDEKLFNTLLQLTKVCTLCNKNVCPGGYNCRHGAINYKNRICYDDFMYGNCKKYNCVSIHLTERGLIPFYKQKNKNYNPSVQQNKNNYVKYKFKRQLVNMSETEGILLTNNFINSQSVTTKKNNYDLNSSESDNEADIEKLIKYINESESDDETIFD